MTCLLRCILGIHTYVCSSPHKAALLPSSPSLQMAIPSFSCSSQNPWSILDAFIFSHFIIQSVMKFGHRHFQNSPRMWPLFSPVLLSQSQPPSSLGWMIAVVFYLVFHFCHCSRQSVLNSVIPLPWSSLSFGLTQGKSKCPCIDFYGLPWSVPATYCLSFLIQLQLLVPWLFLEQSQHTAASGPLHLLLPSPGTLSPVTLA